LKGNAIARNVKRRRLFCLFFMLVFVCWAIVHLVFQHFKILKKEKELQQRATQLSLLRKEEKELRRQLKKLHNEDYLLELSHKLGFCKEDEEIFRVEKKG